MGHLDGLTGVCDAFEARMPSPAGASAAAVVGAVAASVVAMAGDGSPDWSDGARVARDARAARVRLHELGEEDVTAFEKVLVAGREAGRPALPAALEGAALVPLEIGERCLVVAGLAAEAVDHAKRAIRPDAAAAATLAASAVAVAISVVEVNLGHPAFPPGRVDEIRAAAGVLRRELALLPSS